MVYFHSCGKVEIFHFLLSSIWSSLSTTWRSYNVKIISICSQINNFTSCFRSFFPHSWWQNTQKLQINFSPAEPQFNEVSRRLHREAGPTDESRRTTRGVLFSSLLISLDVRCFVNSFALNVVLCSCPWTFSWWMVSVPRTSPPWPLQ